VQLKEYLMILTKSDLLRYDSNTHTFKTTEKGLKFLEAYNQMDNMIKESSSLL
jgi:predicted transcriptional regulator